MINGIIFLLLDIGTLAIKIAPKLFISGGCDEF